MVDTPPSRRWLLLVAISICGACAGPAAPSPTPAGLTAVFEQLALRGATIEQVVGGDAGCTDEALNDNAVRLDVAFEEGEPTYRVYLMRWRRPAQFTASADDFAACRDRYAADNQDVEVDALELAPWRALGPGWSPSFRAALSDALRAAGARD